MFSSKYQNQLSKFSVKVEIRKLISLSSSYRRDRQTPPESNFDHKNSNLITVPI